MEIPIEKVCLSVGDFVDIVNQTLEYAYSEVLVEGEVASFKINQDKYVFFDLKDAEASVGCFMMRYALRFPISDGMKLRVKAVPKLTKWGKFSLTISDMLPVGEGSIKKSFEELKLKLAKEGLFLPSKKRPLTELPTRIGVISSVQAAGYADFCKILGERWGGLELQVAHVQVQGMGAADQIIRALNYFNEHSEVEVLAIIRGGGSADDLAVFNDEALVKAIAVSKIPVLTGIGHEVDESLSDLAADMRASTPSNAAQMLTRDKSAEKRRLAEEMERIYGVLLDKVNKKQADLGGEIVAAGRNFKNQIEMRQKELINQSKIIEQLNPDAVLARGYALVTGALEQGSVVKITTISTEVEAEVKQVRKRELE